MRSQDMIRAVTIRLETKHSLSWPVAPRCGSQNPPWVQRSGLESERLVIAAVLCLLMSLIPTMAERRGFQQSLYCVQRLKCLLKMINGCLVRSSVMYIGYVLRITWLRTMNRTSS